MSESILPDVLESIAAYLMYNGTSSILVHLSIVYPLFLTQARG